MRPWAGNRSRRLTSHTAAGEAAATAPGLGDSAATESRESVDGTRVESELNRRARRVLGDRSPAELFNALLASAVLTARTRTRARSEEHPPLR